jgi:hypothetical protein
LLQYTASWHLAQRAYLFYKETLACCDALKRELDVANDKVQAWINNYCNISDSIARYSAPAAYESYKHMMIEASQVSDGKQDFFKKMREREDVLTSSINERHMRAD